MKLPAKLLIEATLMPVIVDIIAEAGDRLITLNGVCVGVDSAARTAVVPPDQKRLSAPAKKAQPKSRAKQGAKKKVNRTTVLEALTANPGALKAIEIGDHMRANEAQRAQINYYLKCLVTEGQIERDKADPPYRYTIIKQRRREAA